MDAPEVLQGVAEGAREGDRGVDVGEGVVGRGHGRRSRAVPPPVPLSGSSSAVPAEIS